MNKVYVILKNGKVFVGEDTEVIAVCDSKECVYAWWKAHKRRDDPFESTLTNPSVSVEEFDMITEQNKVLYI